ncbi:MAG: hypothetical protein SFZ23_04880 [Planctomycetota bacterium]|nr:hypothetical protein [Planctomycetota bacterium]
MTGALMLVRQRPLMCAFPIPVASIVTVVAAVVVWLILVVLSRFSTSLVGGPNLASEVIHFSLRVLGTTLVYGIGLVGCISLAMLLLGNRRLMLGQRLLGATAIACLIVAVLSYPSIVLFIAIMVGLEIHYWTALLLVPIGGYLGVRTSLAIALLLDRRNMREVTSGARGSMAATWRWTRGRTGWSLMLLASLLALALGGVFFMFGLADSRGLAGAARAFVGLIAVIGVVALTLFIPALFVAAYEQLARDNNAFPADRCHACDYSLVGAKGDRCPECGAAHGLVAGTPHGQAESQSLPSVTAGNTEEGAGVSTGGRASPTDVA